MLACAVTACGGAHHSGISAGTRTAARTTAEFTEKTTLSLGPLPPAGQLRDDEDDDDSSSNATPGNLSKDNDSDYDNDLKREYTGYHDSDDGSVVDYGHVANPADLLAITKLVNRYYAVIATGNGAVACSMMYSIFAEAVVEDYGQPPGPAYSRGKTCAGVMNKILAHFHAMLVPHRRVTGVRVDGRRGRALVGSREAPAWYIYVKKERGTWRIISLLGQALP